MTDAQEDIAREFVECNFLMGAEGDATVMSLPHRQALATWQSFYCSTINLPGQIIQQLLPLDWQCQSVNADSLKSNKSIWPDR